MRDTSAASAWWRPAVIAPALALAAVAGAACTGDDDTAATEAAATTMPETSATPTTAPPTTTSTTTTSTSTTSTSTTTTSTLPPTTTIDVEALKADIAADLIASDETTTAIVTNPSLENLEARVAEAIAPGPLREALINRVQELVALGDVVQPDDPPIDTFTVEEVRWDPAAPDEAWVLVCSVDNLQQVTPGGAPDGSDIVVAEQRAWSQPGMSNTWYGRSVPGCPTCSNRTCSGCGRKCLHAPQRDRHRRCSPVFGRFRFRADRRSRAASTSTRTRRR